jgi:hypothetical protein
MSASLAVALRVHSLVCRSSIDMALRSWTSLARCSDRPLHFVVHDDGSLGPEERDRLAGALPGMTLVDRRGADDAIEPLLQRFPNARAFRRRNALALKLLDIPLLAEAPEIACCDTDVLAFRPFSRLFDWPDPSTTAVFMSDTQNAYAMRPWHLIGTSAIAVPMCVNTGLMMCRTGDHDLDFVEWFLGRQFGVFQRVPGWVEQTCWAALAQRGRCRLYDPSQIRVIRDAGCLADRDLLIGHFTTRVRTLWPDAREPLPWSCHQVAVRTCAPVPLTATRLATEQLRRAVMRGRAWIRTRVAGRGVDRSTSNRQHRSP